MNISKSLAAVIPLLPRFAEEIISPAPQYASNPPIPNQASSDEKREIRVFTRGLRATLQEMETALAVMQEAIEFVQTQKEIYTKSLETHIPLLVPINNIPFEVLSHIFIDVHDLDLVQFHSGLTSHFTTNHSKKECRRPSAPAITIAQVNHQWSRVAMRTPALWSTLVFSADIKYERQLVIASKWLKRSEGSPLTCIILDIDRRRGRSRKPWLQEPSLIPILLPHVSRIRTLRIFGDYLPFLYKLKDENAALSLLETVELDATGSSSSSSYTPKYGESQKLIGLNTGPIRSFKSSPGISLDHFTFDRQSLRLFTGKLSDMHQLHQLPSLRRCRIRITGHREDIRGLTTPPTSHLLTVLWIDLDQYGDEVLQQLGHFPHLQTLLLNKLLYSEYEDCSGLLAFLQTSGQSLRYLSVHFDNFEKPENLCQLLELTPKLERLDCILEERCVEKFLELFAQGNLVPRLCDLYLSMMRDSMEDWSLEEWTPSKNSNTGPRPTTRSPFNVTLCNTEGFADRLRSERQWEHATKSLIENYLPDCKTHCLWNIERENMIFFGKRPGAPMDGLEELYHEFL